MGTDPLGQVTHQSNGLNQSHIGPWASRHYSLLSPAETHWSNWNPDKKMQLLETINQQFFLGVALRLLYVFNIVPTMFYYDIAVFKHAFVQRNLGVICGEIPSIGQ